MAIVRTVLPRKGIIQPRHGDNYEIDLDTNWSLIDSLLQDSEDVEAAVLEAGTVETWLNDRGASGVVSGFALSTSATLTPGLATGVLYAQGKRYAPGSAPSPGPAPASNTSYLFYNSAGGFYYNLTGSPSTTGDAFLGVIVANADSVTAVTTATRLWGFVPLATSSPGNLTVPHYLGRAPIGALVVMKSGGAIWFQSTKWDGANLYLVASSEGLNAEVQIW